jgi:hypothetical protein
MILDAELYRAALGVSFDQHDPVRSTLHLVVLLETFLVLLEFGRRDE